MSHSVQLKTEFLHVAKGGVIFSVQADKRQFGTLEITNASMMWYPRASKSKSSAFKLSWEQFQQLLTDHWNKGG